MLQAPGETVRLPAAALKTPSHVLKEIRDLEPEVAASAMDRKEERSLLIFIDLDKVIAAPESPQLTPCRIPGSP